MRKKRKPLLYLCTKHTHHGVALLDELVDVPARQGSLEEHHDVLDHVLVRDVLEEGRQRLLRLRLQEVELNHLSVNGGARGTMAARKMPRVSERTYLRMPGNTYPEVFVPRMCTTTVCVPVLFLPQICFNAFR